MKQLWSPQELDRFWLLTDEEIALCTGAYSTNRLAFALQLKYLEHEGRFPRHKGEISAKVIGYVARQLDTTQSLRANRAQHGQTHRVRGVNSGSVNYSQNTSFVQC